jgi:hypothetical protein
MSQIQTPTCDPWLFYFLRRIKFAATATTPPTASSDNVSGSGIGRAQAAAGAINNRAVISLYDFIVYAYIFRVQGFNEKTQDLHQ